MRVPRARASAPTRRTSSRPWRRCPGRRAAGCAGRQIMSPRPMSMSSVELDGDRLRRRTPRRAACRPGRRSFDTRVVKPDGSTVDLVAGLEHAAGDGAGVAAVVVQVASSCCGRITYCTGKRASIRLRSEAMCTSSRWCSSEGPSYQGMASLRVTTLSPVSADDRDEGQVVDLELHGEVAELVADLLEALLRVVDEVHLVDAHDQVRDAEQAGQEGVPAGLLEHAVAGVDAGSARRRRSTRR